MSDVDVLRSFNRSFTQRVGLLDQSYLKTGRPLGPSRLLFEVGLDGAAVADLRQRLGLDSGYLSRLLRRLEAEGLIGVGPDPTDRRQRRVRPTAKGRREWRRLDQRADEVARRLVEPLSNRQRAELDDALGRAQRLLAAATVRFVTTDPRTADARRAMDSYFAELDQRFPTGFDPGDALTADIEALSPPHGALVLVRSDEMPVGCGGVQRVDGRTGEVKRMWIDPAWRGLNLGARLLTHLEGVARQLGYRRVVLDTNASLTEAMAMYQANGYQPTERYNDNPYAQRWFTKVLTAPARYGLAPAGTVPSRSVKGNPAPC